MIKPGLCSVCFKPKSPREIIDLASNAGLSAIEWIGSVHVPAGDISTAKEVGDMTRESGLDVASYGSVFRLGTNDDVVPHLESAKALGATEMRIWAGNGKASTELSREERQAFVLEAKKASCKAAEYGISLSTECHEGGLTDCIGSQLLYMNEVNETNFRTYWQELLSLPRNEQYDSLYAIHNSGKLTNLHIYQYIVDESGRERQPLSEGFEKWKERFLLFKNDAADRYALLEFVRDYTPESLYNDAKILIELSEYANR